MLAFTGVGIPGLFTYLLENWWYFSKQVCIKHKFGVFNFLQTMFRV